MKKYIKIMHKNGVNYVPEFCDIEEGSLVSFYLDGDLQFAVPYESFISSELVKFRPPNPPNVEKCSCGICTPNEVIRAPGVEAERCNCFYHLYFRGICLNCSDRHVQSGGGQESV